MLHIVLLKSVFPAMAAREILAPGGIHHMAPHSHPLSSPLLPCEEGALEVGPINPAMGSEERCKFPSAVWVEVHFEDLETLLMTSKMCIVLYAHNLSLHAHPSLNRAHRIFVYFVSQKLPHPFRRRLLLAPWGICPLCPFPPPLLPSQLIGWY